MKTKITIEFEEEVPEGMLRVLLAQLNVVCGQNKEGYGWGGGKHTAEVEVVKDKVGEQGE